MGFSPGDLDTIASFAADLGLPARPARDGSFSFVFADSGTLALTPSDDGPHVSLSRRPDRVDARMLRAALGQAGRDPAHGRIVHVGLASDDSLLMSIRLDPNELSLPVLDDCLQRLRHHQRVAS